MRPRLFNGSLATRLRRAGAIAVLTVFAVLLTRCSLDRGTGASGTVGVLSIGLRPVLPPDFSFFASNLAIGQVRLTLVRPPSDTIARVTRAMPSDSAAVTFAVTAALRAASESLVAILDYQTAQGVTLFTGQVMVQATVGTPTPSAPVVPLSYSGPGLNIASLNLAPLSDTVIAGDSTLYQLTAIDSSQQPVTSFYVSWTTSDSRVPINAVGLVRAPDITKTITVTALTPNGTFAQTDLTILGSGLGILPDSVEMLPGGRQQFTVAIGAAGPYTWSVRGVDGGNATFGTVDPAGLYIAPSTLPNPSVFQVCARVTAAPTQQGCATVALTSVPSAGTDVIVINDMNLFDVGFMAQNVNNRRFAANLINYLTTGTRNNSRVAMYDRGRASTCFGNGECGDGGNATIDSVLAANGFSIVKVDTLASWASIPPNVKVIFLWNPTVAYSRTDINGFKLFASQGGRIVFLGEHVGFYGTAGINTENQFLADMGSQFTNVGAVLACIETIPANQIQAHQTTVGLTDITIACASEAQPGPNDFPLFFESTGLAVAGVAKISTVPLPVPPAGAAPEARRQSVAPAVNGLNRRQ